MRQSAAVWRAVSWCAVQSADAELLEEDGPKRKWRLDYSARWNFWKVSGVCENRWAGILLTWAHASADLPPRW